MTYTIGHRDSYNCFWISSCPEGMIQIPPVTFLFLEVSGLEVRIFLYLKYLGDFPGGTVVKNPPANAGDAGSSPGPGRSHMPWSNEAREPQLLSPRATTTEARAPRVRVLQQEKPPQ